MCRPATKWIYLSVSDYQPIAALQQAARIAVDAESVPEVLARLLPCRNELLKVAAAIWFASY